MIKLAVIADDLTGANDTAVQFAKYGINSYVLIDAANQDFLLECADVVVLDTDSRAVLPLVAYDRVKKACQTLKVAGVNHVYKKIDSTLRGNLGAEIEAAVEVFCPDIIVIAPAFPRNNRITVGGYHLLNQLPVSLTEIARDPKTPVRESHLPELLRKQTKSEVGHIPLQVILEGVSNIRTAIADKLKQGAQWLVFDVVTDDDLRQIAIAASEYNNILWVGSAGLAEVLSERYGWRSCATANTPPAEGPVLLVVGSVSQVTRNQVAAFLEQPLACMVEVNVAEVLSNQREEVDRCILAAKDLLVAGRNVVITSTVPTDGSNRAVTEIGYCASKNEVSNRIAAVLGDIVAELAAIKLAGMVLTGGDTAVHVCRALGAGSVEILKEVAAGIPLGRLNGGPFAGLRIVTKAGAFGDEQALVRAMHAIKGIVKQDSNTNSHKEVK